MQSLESKAALSQELEQSLQDLLNTSVTTASKYEQRLEDAPASVIIITNEQIRLWGYKTLAEVLRATSGFFISDDRNYTSIGVRGFQIPASYNNKLLLLIDGHRVNEQSYGGALFGNGLGLDLDIIERIEIVKGPGSALYGTGAVLAVINIIPKKGKRFDGMRINYEHGSFGANYASLFYGKEFSGLDVLVSAVIGDIKGKNQYYKEFDSPETNNGIAEELDWEKYYGFFSMVSYKNYSLRTYYASRDKGIPTASYSTRFNDSKSKTLDDRLFVDFRYERQINPSMDLVMRAFFDYYDYAGVYPYDDYKMGDGNNGRWLGTEIQYNWDIFSNNRLSAGIEYNYIYKNNYWVDYDDERAFFKDKPSNIASAYIQNNYRILDNFSVLLGLRYDNYSKSDNSLNPRVALIYNPIKTGALKLIYGNAFRTPNLYELEYQEPEVQKNNPHLLSEEVRTAEISYSQRIGENLFLSLCVFNYNMRNLIDLTQNEEDGLMQYKNISQADSKGFEFELSSRYDWGLMGYLNYNYSYTQIPDSAKIINSPSHLVKVGLSQRFIKHFNIAIDCLYETERLTTNREKGKPYFFTMLNLNYVPNFQSENAGPKNLFNRIRLSFAIRNIFNEKYFHPAGYEHKQQLIEQNGRSFLIRATFIY